MKINYATLHNMNETHISFEAIKRSSKKGEMELVSKKTNKRKDNIVRGLKRIDWESVCDGRCNQELF